MGINQAELDAASASVGNAVPSTLVNTATGYTFGAGYQFNRYVGAEFSYINFNTLSYDNPSPGPTVGVDFMPRSYNLFAVGTVPLGRHFAVYGKAGIAFTRLTANTNELQVYSTTANATKAAVGGGIEAIFNKNFSVRGEYTYFGTIGDPPDYEPTPDRTVAGIAAARGTDPLATMYDLMLESGGTAMLMLP